MQAASKYKLEILMKINMFCSTPYYQKIQLSKADCLGNTMQITIQTCKASEHRL